jgi:hypothetical protein
MASYPYPGVGSPAGGGSGGTDWKKYLIPAIAVLVGAGSSLLKSKAAGKSVAEQNALYNQYLLDRQKGVTGLIDKLSGAGFNPFGPQVTTATGTDRNTKLVNAVTQERKTPFITPDYQALEGMFRDIAENRLKRPDALPPGYIERSVAGINQSFAGASAAARNAAARKGLSGEQAFGLAAPMESSRAGKIGDFLSTVPLKERELQNEDVSMAANLASTFGLGSDTIRKTTEQTNDAGSYSKTLSSPPNLGALAALMLPPGPNAGTQSGQSTAGQVGGDLATFLAWLWTQGAFGGNKPQGA